MGIGKQVERIAATATVLLPHNTLSHTFNTHTQRDVEWFGSHVKNRMLRRDPQILQVKGNVLEQQQFI